MGKLVKNRNHTDGFILLDVLVALIIAGIALVVVFGNIAMATRSAAITKERLMLLIVQRNNYAEKSEIQFNKE